MSDIDQNKQDKGPLERPEVLTEQQQEEVDRYTLVTRKRSERLPIRLPLHRRIIQAIEGVNRRFWYALIRKTLDNPPPTRKIPISELESLLIMPYGDAVGDMIAALPIVDAVKKRNPKTRIGIITSARNESLLRCEKQIDEQYSFIGRKDWKHYSELRRARRDKYQVILNIHFAQMSDQGIYANIMGPSAIKVSVSHPARKNIYKALFNHLSESLRFRVHLTQLSFKLLDDVVDFDPPLRASESRLRINVCEDSIKIVNDQIDQLLEKLEAKWFIYYNPEARNPFREYGMVNFAKFAKRFTEQYPEAAIFVTSSPVRQQGVRNVIEQGSLARVAFFETSYDLLELAALSRRAKLVITPDTSIIHFATAERRPVLILWPDIGNLPTEWLPLHTPSIHLSPAIRREPVSTIPVHHVMQAASDLIDGRVTTSSTSLSFEDEPRDAFQVETADELLIQLIDRHIVTKS
jgi:ADP-heptose:LPS heptosyltransferase